jgi:diacylglycerol kinase family enzyme
LGAFDVEVISSPCKFTTQVARAIDRGEDTFIAAGGDGTVHLLLNALMRCAADPSRFTLGAIGLGSSNDFHKPFRSDRCLGTVPVRIDSAQAILSDLIRVDYENQYGQEVTRYSLINASIGLTAAGNAFFTTPDPLIRAIRAVSVEVAILSSALKAIVNDGAVSCRIAVDGGTPERLSITNLGVCKNPHFAGSLCYDTPVAPDDGKLCVNLCHDLSLPEKLRMLYALSRRRFSRLPKTRSHLVERLTVACDRAFALEIDGEIDYTRSARFRVIPKAVRCCR